MAKGLVHGDPHPGNIFVEPCAGASAEEGAVDAQGWPRRRGAPWRSLVRGGGDTAHHRPIFKIF